MKIKTLSVMLCVVVSLVAGCAKKETDHIAIFYNDYNDEYAERLRMSINKRFSETKNIELVTYNAKLKQDIQLNQVNDEIEKGTRLIAVNAVDNHSENTVLKIVDMAKNADIPLIFFDRYVDCTLLDDFYKAVYIGWDDENLGAVQGNMVGKYLLSNYDMFDMNGDGTINYAMLAETDKVNNTDEYHKQFMKETEKILSTEGKPLLNFFDSTSTHSYQTFADVKDAFEEAYNYMKEKLAVEEVVVELIVATSDEMALGAVKALQEVGYNSENAEKFIPVFGIGASKEAQNAIHGNVITGSLSRAPDYMSKIFKIVCENVLNGRSAFEGIDNKLIHRKNCILVPYEQFYGKKNI